MAFLLGRLEANLARRRLRRIIESVPQSLNHSQNLNVPARCENHLNQYIPFDFLGSSFVCVGRFRLESNLDRRRF